MAKVVVQDGKATNVLLPEMENIGRKTKVLVEKSSCEQGVKGGSQSGNRVYRLFTEWEGGIWLAIFAMFGGEGCTLAAAKASLV